MAVAVGIRPNVAAAQTTALRASFENDRRKQMPVSWSLLSPPLVVEPLPVLNKTTRRPLLEEDLRYCQMTTVAAAAAWWLWPMFDLDEAHSTVAHLYEGWCSLLSTASAAVAARVAPVGCNNEAVRRWRVGVVRPCLSGMVDRRAAAATQSCHRCQQREALRETQHH
jgi:hypothetical protein